MLALITATKNSIRTVEDALTSAASFRNRIKHYLIDSASSDGTLEYLESFVAATDNNVLMLQKGTGLFPALNQAVEAALTDPEVTHIGFLHSDDRLIPNAYREYLARIESSQYEFFYSDIEYHDHKNRRVRVWSAGCFSIFKLKTGWMPPHTSVVVTKRIYRDFGLYDPTFGTAADYEWIVRVLSPNSASIFYHPQRTLTMRVGGASGATVSARIRANVMDGKAWADHSLAQSLVVRFCKPLRKLTQFNVFPQLIRKLDSGSS